MNPGGKKGGIGGAFSGLVARAGTLMSRSGKKGGGKDLHDPVKECPLKASITVQVDAVNDEDGTREAVAGVSTKIVSGPSKASGKATSGAGLANYSGLKPGSYEVGIKVEGEKARFYDLVPPPAAQTKSVGGGTTQIYEFELRSYWVGARILWGIDRPAKGYPFRLKVKAMTPGGNLSAAFAMHHEGNSAEKPYLEKYVPKGRYELSVVGISDAQWGAARVVVGEAVELSAKVSGVDVGTAGTLTVYDVRNLTKAIETVNVTVAAGAGGKELKGSWTPAKGKLTDLHGSEVVFEAKVGAAQGISGPVPVVVKEKFEVVDSAAKKLDGHLSLYYSGGAKVEADAAGGTAEVFAPWGQKLARIEYGVKPCAVKFEEEGAAARGFLLSA